MDESAPSTPTRPTTPPPAPRFAKPTTEQLRNRYTHHPPKGDQGSRYSRVRESICRTAEICVGLTPCSPEQTRALNALDEAMMLFNAAIARNE